MHSINSWKDTAHLQALAAIMAGKKPYYYFKRKSAAVNTYCGWIVCRRCKRACCSRCADMIQKKIRSEKLVSEATFAQNDLWLCMVSEFLEVTPPGGRVSVISIPPSISHCCRLGCEVRSKRNQLARKRNKTIRFHNPFTTRAITNDGLLHYAPYRLVIAPSFRFYETLCVAEQGFADDTFHQEPVYHSVIPNEMAQKYDQNNIFPNGSFDDVVISDYYSYVPVTLPFEKNKKVQHFLVRRLLIKFSTDYDAHPENGTCSLSDEEYFKRCFRVFDEVWENNDINNDVDVCLITGEPGPKDNGRNEILLSGRIYTNGFEIPPAYGNVKNDFLKACFSSMKKEGYETNRIGGSAGSDGATPDQLNYFQKHRGSFPNIASAVVHISRNNGTWRAYYISPYAKSKEKMVAVHAYSTPKPGGQIDWRKEIDDIYPRFFDNMSKVRSTMSSILLSIESKCAICISPLAVKVQQLYNFSAREEALSGTDLRLMDALSKQVVYSIVPYTVGSHRDVTKTGCAREFIECKACLIWPSRSKLGTTFSYVPALGRGGAGPGTFTVMIVDHPQKKIV
jgi:hypothetical protein